MRGIIFGQADDAELECQANSKAEAELRTRTLPAYGLLARSQCMCSRSVLDVAGVHFDWDTPRISCLKFVSRYQSLGRAKESLNSLCVQARSILAPRAEKPSMNIVFLCLA